MRRKLLVDKENRGKEIGIFEDPARFRRVANEQSWRVLKLLSEEPLYPAEIAKRLKIHQQRVYYHIRNLKQAGLIKVAKEEEISGATAKYYVPTVPAFGFEISRHSVPVPTRKLMEEKVGAFFTPHITDGQLDATIVVGSPDPHGPFKTTGRDGHYAIQLGLFLGQYVGLPERFIPKLDVDVKAEKEEANNLILIGGPGTNILTAEINKQLPLRFNEKNYWAGIIGLKNIYTSDSTGLIAKIPNPYDSEKSIVALAGLRSVGTKATVIALTQFTSKVLRSYGGQDEWARVVQGFDLDGDGKVDSVEILETT